MTKVIEQRKRDHLILAQDKKLQFNISAGFDRWRFRHNALPEIDLQDIDASTTFLGKRLTFPFLISSMSGGLKEGEVLNANLAKATHEMGCALALGSMRPALEDPSARQSFLIARKLAPDALILANIGIGQALDPDTIDPVSRFCDDLAADGLIIHLNSMQEAFQPEGQTTYRGALETVAEWVRNFPRPIIIKEVGQGLSPELIARLEDVGVEHVDIAGAGGSNWINIENARRQDHDLLKAVAPEFHDWGEPTAEVLEQIDTPATVIASGGLKAPMDMAIALALGADLVGAAGPLLKPALRNGPDQLIRTLEIWKKTLELVMFGVGISDLKGFIGNRGLLTHVKDHR